jgi:hypothetical protein
MAAQSGPLSQPPPPGRPRDVEVVAPEGWYAIDLDPQRTDRCISVLMDRQFRGRDDLPHVKADLARALRARAVEARNGGGLQFWLCLELAGTLPLPASLFITVVGAPAGGPGGGEQAPEVLEVLRTRRVERGDDVALVETGLGTALRTRRLAAFGEPPEDLPATVLDFHCPIPHSDKFLLLTFSTPIPVPPLRDAFVELFDAMAGAARWVQ